MKNIIIFLALFTFLFVGIQDSFAQGIFEKEKQSEQSTQKSFSSEAPEGNYYLGLRTGEWGGGDAPDPDEEDSTGGDRTPIGEGLIFCILLSIFYLICKILRLRNKKEDFKFIKL